MLKIKSLFAAVSLLYLGQYVVASDAEPQYEAGLGDWLIGLFMDVPEAIEDVLENIKAKPAWHAVKMQPYHKIELEGKVQVQIKPSSNYDVQMWDNSAELSYDDDTLHIRANHPIDNQSKTHVILKHINDLDSLILHDDSRVYGKDTKNKTTSLSLATHDHATLNLEGVLNIRKILQNSSEKSTVFWVDSPNLEVIANTSTIEIAGVVKNLKLWGYNDSTVEAQHLRSKNTWVTSKDSSHIRTNPLGYLYAHATNHSLIEYRDHYKINTLITQDNANIIPLHSE